MYWVSQHIQAPGLRLPWGLVVQELLSLPEGKKKSFWRAERAIVKWTINLTDWVEVKNKKKEKKKSNKQKNFPVLVLMVSEG